MKEIMVTSSLLITALVVLRRLWRNKISRRLQYGLWLLVALRLLVPVAFFENPFNVMSLLQAGVQGKELPRYDSVGTGRVVYHGDWAKENKSVQEAGILSEPGNVPVDPGSVSEEQDLPGKAACMKTPSQTAPETGGAGSSLGLGTQERILKGGPDLGGFFARDLWHRVWYTGMAAVGLWMTGCSLVFRRRLGRNRRVLGREGGLPVYLAEGIGSPCLLGVFHPAVYLTRDCVQNQRHREHAVLHELTHYRHGDHVWALVRSLCLVVYWFDPLVWLAVFLSSRDCEMACDEGMVYRLGEARSQEYGRTLIEMAASGGGGTGLFRCAPGFSVRKRELKERILQIASGKKHTGVLVAALVALCGILLAACTFGGTKTEDEMGRYVETAVAFSGQERGYYGVAQEGRAIRLIAAAGVDWMCAEGGEEFVPVEISEMPRGVLDLSDRYPTYVAGSPKGARLYYIYEGFGKDITPSTYVITEAGEEIRLEVLGDHWVRFFYSQGSFWIYEGLDAGSRCWQLDPATGEMKLLAEGTYSVNYMAADQALLYLVSSSGVQLFDLEAGEPCAKQDQVLSDFSARENTPSETSPVMLYPWKDGVYLLTHQGLYWHKLYDETVELVIDGGFCSMGDMGRTFAGLAIRETGGEPEFFLLYTGGELMHYTYDASLPAVPDALRIYSVYEDSQVSKAVNGFRAQHPEVPVVYEVGMNAAYGATVDDVLKNLATEIAAGKGPDILVMDDIPFDSYVEKGVLADLSSLREGMNRENYFVNVIDSFARDGKLYAIPMTFAVPVLAGREELLEGAESLADLADLLEQERNRSSADYVFCTWDAESTLRLLAQSSQGAWMREGALDREAVEEFLTQGKRIYDIQFSENGEPDKNDGGRYLGKHQLIMPDLWIGNYRQYPLARRFDSDGLYCMLDKAKWRLEEVSCYGGFLSGGERDYLMIQAIQKADGDTCVRMPGQQYGTCLASSLLAVSAGTERPEESLLFLEYAVSSGFLSEGDLNGTPISREAYLKKQGTAWRPVMDGDSIYSTFEVKTYSGKTIEYNLYIPTTEDYVKLTRLLDGVTGVNNCDTVVYETVVEYGKRALTGEMSIQEAMEAIEKRVKIYLAE